MVFASLSFIFILLPLFLASDIIARYISCKNIFNLKYTFSLRNFIFLVISLLFYTWGESTNVFILIVLGIINYYAGKFIYIHRNKKWITACFIIINLSVLIGFKYIPWLVSILVPWINIKQQPLPLGISFFTFHAISYLIDIHRGNIHPADSALKFLTYFCMFPHLVAGPIVRYSQVQDDLIRRGPDIRLFNYGMYRFIIGLNKKVLIANSVSYLADTAFTLSTSGHLAFIDAWIGIIAYSIQIYFDFSGYSDMAIGLAAMAGFHFEENFRRPYSSTSIRDFWRRWHISLSSWLRDYLYIPLGGSRCGNLNTYRNLFIVFFLCGLWHGANTTFIIWGLWHGCFLILERAWLGRILDQFPTAVTRFYTLLIVILGWVFFRAESMSDAVAYMQTLFSPSFGPVLLSQSFMGLAALFIGMLLCLIPDALVHTPTCREPDNFSLWRYGLHAILAVISIAILATSTRNPFIYFNF